MNCYIVIRLIKNLKQDYLDFFLVATKHRLWDIIFVFELDCSEFFTLP